MQANNEVKYWNPYVAGVALGILLFVSFFVVSHGLGASGGLNRLVAFTQSIFAQEHVNTTPYLAKMAATGKNPFDSWLVWEIIGVLIGGFASGMINKRVKVETHMGAQLSSPKVRWAMAFAGGTIMGFGARFARGCTSGQGLSGGSVMSVGSWVFLFAVFGGGYLTAYFLRNFWLAKEKN